MFGTKAEFQIFDNSVACDWERCDLTVGTARDKINLRCADKCRDELVSGAEIRVVWRSDLFDATFSAIIMASTWSCVP